MDSLDGKLRKQRASLLALLKENAHLEVRDLRFPIFSLLCDTLYDAAKDWHGYSKEKDFPFYLWPGYDTIRIREGEPQRVQLRVPGTELLGTVGGGIDIACGISPPYPVPSNGRLPTSLELLVDKRREGLKDRFSNHDRYHAYTEPGLVTWDAAQPKFRVLINPASVFFTALLTGPHEPEELGEFIPGSTHRWLSEYDVHVDGPSPRGLIVNYATASKTIQSNFFLSVDLEKRLDKVGPRIGNFLDRVVKEPTWRWPAVLSGADQQMSHLQLRRAMYTPWLMAVFTPKRTKDSIATALNLLTPTLDKDTDYLKRRLEYVRGTAESVGEIDTRAVSFIIKCSSYRHWYSLVLDAAPGKLGLQLDSTILKTPDVSLGTAMLFSGKPLRQDFLTLIRNWLQEVLLLLRESEGSAAAVETGELKQAFDQYSAISHEFKDIVPLISKANGKPYILKQFQYWLLGYSLPAFSKLEKASSGEQLPEAITGEGINDFYEWISQLSSAAAGIQALVIPRELPDSPEIWDKWVNAITSRFELSPNLREHKLPEDFSTRCLLGVSYVCALRNSVKHSFTRRGASDPAPLYRWKGDGKIQIAKAEQRITGWPSTVLTIRNFCPEKGRSAGLDGTAGAISFYLGELKKRLGIEEPFPFETSFVDNAYVCSLPLISHTA
jgi:hypothetical protein